MHARIGRLGVIVVAAIVQLATLVLAHNLVYLARYGSRFNEELVHSGHGDGWKAAAATSIGLSAIAATVAIVRLLRLHVLVRRERTAPAGSRLERSALLRTWLRIAPALALSTVALLTLQENLEQLALHGASAGIGILITPEYAGGLWIALAVGLLIGVVVALVAWRLHVLATRLREARSTAAAKRVQREAARPALVIDRPATSILGRRSA
ncbi:MAG TPA: hypothetical protein VFI15_11320, partial [Candidatus Limnocylindrales bacterium]|nr:hypothetical protein [Candidatus Limnocylindrales bacterium]